MSKRHGATSIRDYRRQGFLPQALVNYLMLLGWSAGDDKEILDLAQAKDIFDIKAVNKSGAAFALDRLQWLNGEYIRRAGLDRLTDLIALSLEGTEFLPAGTPHERLREAAALFQPRLNN